ncbi:delta-60 repeat domain-containing protein [Sphingobacterium sp. E70]|uniref:delta-60 repeat domain-containing protein n=1 Tax=Sphingobacterium sp. E70 TaxID=2853439 RepID=UPI00211C0CC0|nr:delta-60 repeat domain-containing protein [Sphingobacterium sp. E70]ULT28004.1 delta-60 repeat domain-containing protein [Sphingobacterium sp. E70]
MDDGLIVVAGDFVRYNNIARNGFMILNPTGELNAAYNTSGYFSGYVNKAVETRTEDGKRALLIMGSFSRFNNEQVHNLIRIKLEQ